MISSPRTPFCSEAAVLLALEWIASTKFGMAVDSDCPGLYLICHPLRLRHSPCPHRSPEAVLGIVRSRNNVIDDGRGEEVSSILSGPWHRLGASDCDTEPRPCDISEQLSDAFELPHVRQGE